MDQLKALQTTTNKAQVVAILKESMAAIKVSASDSQNSILCRPTPEISELNCSADTLHLKSLYGEFEAKRKELYDLQFQTVDSEEKLTELQTKYDCLNEDMKTISGKIRYLKQNGNFSTQNGLLLFEWVVVNIIEYYGVKWSDMQVNDCAMELNQNYYWLQLGELKLFICYVKNGVYREAKNLAPYHLLQWIDAFATESMRIREQTAIIEANNLRYDERWGSVDDRKVSHDKDSALYIQMQQIKSQLNQEKK